MICTLCVIPAWCAVDIFAHLFSQKKTRSFHFHAAAERDGRVELLCVRFSEKRKFEIVVVALVTIRSDPCENYTRARQLRSSSCSPSTNSDPVVLVVREFWISNLFSLYVHSRSDQAQVIAIVMCWLWRRGNLMDILATLSHIWNEKKSV